MVQENANQMEKQPIESEKFLPATCQEDQHLEYTKTSETKNQETNPVKKKMGQ